jgi:septum formation protein
MLLESAGLDFDVVPADIDETPLDGESPAEYVLRVGAEKAEAVAGPGRIVVAADTTVEAGGQILAKPTDDDDARRMLQQLSGNVHRVHTGIAVADDGRIRRELVSTEVRFVALTADAIEWYVATGEPRDKAGAYAIQGRAAAFVESVTGSVTNVVGLPLAETLDLLRSVTANP